MSETNKQFLVIQASSHPVLVNTEDAKIKQE